MERRDTTVMLLYDGLPVGCSGQRGVAHCMVIKIAGEIARDSGLAYN